MPMVFTIGTSSYYFITVFQLFPSNANKKYQIDAFTAKNLGNCSVVDLAFQNISDSEGYNLNVQNLKYLNVNRIRIESRITHRIRIRQQIVGLFKYGFTFTVQYPPPSSGWGRSARRLSWRRKKRPGGKRRRKRRRKERSTREQK